MFDDSNLWCDDCEHSNSGECNQHGALIVVPDSSTISRARQSLPSILEIKRIKDSKQGLSVFSKENIKRRTRFGPLQAPLKSKSPLSSDKRSLTFKLFGTDKEAVWFNTEPGNEDFCNWMVFVAVARAAKEQNLAAFQYQSGIYFVTIKDIAAGEELRVWYAKEYAACMGTTPLQKTEAEESSPPRQLRPRPQPTCAKCQRQLATARTVCVCSSSLTKAVQAPSRRGRRRRNPAVSAMASERDKNLPNPVVPESAESNVSKLSGQETSSDLPPQVVSREDLSDVGVETRSVSKFSGSELVHNVASALKMVDDDPQHSKQSSSSELFTTDLSLPSTSRQGLRSSTWEGQASPVEGQRGIRSGRKSVSDEAKRRMSTFKSKKDIKNEENIQRAIVSSQASLLMERKRAAKSTTSPGRHVCHVCSKAFGSPGKLSQHMYSHTGERPFECTQCKKAFSSKFKLVRHVLIHSDERRYRCTVCERTFHRKDHLKNHVKVHSPVKKTYRCERDGCGKEYSSFLSFRKHVAVHAAEEGNLECKMCGKVFSTKEEIVYHLKVHAGSRTVKNPSDKKYRCDHCERKFFTRKDVRRHLVVHTGKRDFLCQFCPQRFGRKDHLVRHIKKSHHTAGSGPMTRGRGKRVRVPTMDTSRRSNVTPSRPSTSKTVPVSSDLEYEGDDPSLLAGPTTSFSDIKEDKDVIILDEDVQSQESLKTQSIEAMLQESSPDSDSIILKSEPSHLSSGDRSTCTVHHRPQTSAGTEAALLTELVYGHQHSVPPPPPPPPYPTTASYKPFEHSGNVKLEFPSPRISQAEGSIDISQYLNLMPSTSTAHLADDIIDEGSGEVQEELHRFLSSSDASLVSDPNISSQILHLMESAATSLDIPSPAAASQSEMMASLLESTEDVPGTPTPLPRFNQAFQQQQQQPPPPP